MSNALCLFAHRRFEALHAVSNEANGGACSLKRDRDLFKCCLSPAQAAPARKFGDGILSILYHLIPRFCALGRGASLLLPVPGGEAGPSGVLVCGENWVAYKHQDHPEVRAPLPRRKTMPVGRGLLVTSGTLHQQPGLFFHLIQSELGDLYKAR